MIHVSFPSFILLRERNVIKIFKKKSESDFIYIKKVFRKKFWLLSDSIIVT